MAEVRWSCNINPWLTFYLNIMDWIKPLTFFEIRREKIGPFMIRVMIGIKKIYFFLTQDMNAEKKNLNDN